MQNINSISKTEAQKNSTPRRVMVTIDPGSQNNPPGEAYVIKKTENYRFAAPQTIPDSNRRIEANLKSSRILSDAQTQQMVFESFSD